MRTPSAASVLSRRSWNGTTICQPLQFSSKRPPRWIGFERLRERSAMRTLAEIQTGIRHAVVNGDIAAVGPLLLGGTHPEHRLAIHQRHYVASLSRALVERFPATVWLVGSELVTHAATSFVREKPPSRPCIAEYGDGFPRYLGAHPDGQSLPYLAQFAELEWHLGRLALEIGRASCR